MVFDFHVLKEDYQLSIAFEIESNGKSVLIGLDDYVENSWGNQDPLDKGLYRKTCTLPANYFGEDTLGGAKHDYLHQVIFILSFLLLL